jgi:hypothetical protein
MALNGWDVRPWRPTAGGVTVDIATPCIRRTAMSATISPAAPPTRPAAKKPTAHVPLLWVGFVSASLLALDLLSLTVWSIAVPLAAAAL